MKPKKKIRRDAFYAQLTDEQRAAAFARAHTAPWYEVAQWMRAEFGLKAAPKRQAFYDFLAYMRDEDAALRLAAAAQAVRHVGDLAAADGLADDAIVATFKTLAAEAQMNRGDTETAQRLIAMAVNLRRQVLEAEKLTLDREKFESAERRLAAAAKTVSDDTLTDEQRVARIKNIFGIR